jgi:hypothetical protein
VLHGAVAWERCASDSIPCCSCSESRTEPSLRLEPCSIPPTLPADHFTPQLRREVMGKSGSLCAETQLNQTNRHGSVDVVSSSYSPPPPPGPVLNASHLANTHFTNKSRVIPCNPHAAAWLLQAGAYSAYLYNIAIDLAQYVDVHGHISFSHAVYCAITEWATRWISARSVHRRCRLQRQLSRPRQRPPSPRPSCTR